MAEKEDVSKVKETLLDLTARFCQDHLDEEYHQLCVKLIEKLARKRPPPFLRGKPENWSAGIINALGTINFLFDKSFGPYVAASDIAAYFGVAPSTMAQKSKVIREMFKMNRLGSNEFSTTHSRQGYAPIMEALNQLAAVFTPGEELRLGAPSDPEEFIDRDHPAMEAYYDLCERYETQGPTKSIQAALRKLIAHDPDFLDPYLMLADLLDEQEQVAEADRLIGEAGQRALRVITAGTGDWPKSLNWGWLENRHLIRALYTKAISFWTHDEPEPALDLLRKLLRSNPEDNLGVRYQILAIRLGMTENEFEAKFNKGGFYDSDLPNWFDKNVTKYPDEFDWWRKAVEYDE